MSDFIDFKGSLRQQFNAMSTSVLFKTDVSKEALWDTYLASFPAGTNPNFRERTEHDCQCCKQFIRACGSVVSITDNKLVSIWDIEVGGHYQVVSDAMSKLVKSAAVRNIFLYREKNLGTDCNHQMVDGESIQWNHFHYKLPARFVKNGEDIASVLSHAYSGKEVFKRGLSEITVESVETVLELIDQNSLYRGEEHKAAVEKFAQFKREYSRLDPGLHDNYAWAVSAKIGGAARVRNTAIGTLLVDISDGVELDRAVKSFEAKVAPTNYRRPTALITKSMIANTQKKVVELGLESAIPRRHATIDDITINNILFADRTAKKQMNVFDVMTKEAPTTGNYDKVEEVGIQVFISDILPKAERIEVRFENKHSGNLMSLIAPVNEDVEPLFKWRNNFSWAYNGEVADSMKQRVKKAGGNVEGVLRFSIQWNDGDNNQNDFDAHCIEPDGNCIHYPKQRIVQPSTGVLDVDITSPGRNIAVENITWSDINKMQPGEYRFLVENYSHNGGNTGFTAEIEYDGVIHSYEYSKELRNKEQVVVADVVFSKTAGVAFTNSLPSTHATRQVWGIHTNQFHQARVVMHSPNHWDGESTGNKHWFFILEDCRNENKVRGFFNEFLKNELTEHRKVFEVLGSKMKADYSEHQLSGLGFSSTQRNSILCKVSGSFNRVIKINF